MEVYAKVVLCWERVCGGVIGFWGWFIKNIVYNFVKIKKVLLLHPLIRGTPEVRDVAQPGSALAWGARGRKFESCRPDKSH